MCQIEKIQFLSTVLSLCTFFPCSQSACSRIQCPPPPFPDGEHSAVHGSHPSQALSPLTGWSKGTGCVPLSTCLSIFYLSDSDLVYWKENPRLCMFVGVSMPPVHVGEEKKAASVLYCECLFVVNLLCFPSPNSSKKKKAPFKAAAHNSCFLSQTIIFSEECICLCGRQNKFSLRLQEGRKWCAERMDSISIEKLQQFWATKTEFRCWTEEITGSSELQGFVVLYFASNDGLIDCFCIPICGVSDTAARELLGELALW